MTEFDVLVVGAGIAGASAAWRLAEHHSVLLIEAEAQPGYHSTGRSAAMFMESYGAHGVQALTRASRAFYEKPPAGFTPTPLLAPRGALYVAQRDQAALLDDLDRELAGNGAALHRLDAAAALARAPCLRPDTLLGALFEADAQNIDANALHQGFLRGLRARGAELRCGQRAVAARHDGRHWQVKLAADGAHADTDAVKAAFVVNAAGAWADELAACFGVPPVGLEPRRRSAFTFAAPEGVNVSQWPAVVSVGESWYFKPDAGRLLGSPANADATHPHDVQPEELDIATGIYRIEAATSLQIRRPLSTWAGLRSFVRDGELVIGPDAHAPGFFWLAAQGGYGIQSAAGASELLAACVLGQPMPESLLAQGLRHNPFLSARLR